MIRPGASWGGAVPAGTPVREVTGDDAALAAAAAPGVVLRLGTGSTAELARALGLARPGAGPGTTVVDCDLIDLAPPAPDAADAGPIAAVAANAAANAVVLGIPPDALRAWHRRRPVTVTVDGRALFAGPATTVVVANGQFLRGADLVPRGHPGDGRLEVQVYGLAPGERGPMRRRLGGGDHVPHPRITQGQGRRIDVRWARPAALEVDGRRRDRVAGLVARVRPGALRVLV